MLRGESPALDLFQLTCPRPSSQVLPTNAPSACCYSFYFSSAAQHITLVMPSCPPHCFPPSCGFISSSVPFSFPITFHLHAHSLKTCVVSHWGSHALDLCAHFLLNLCRRWATLAGNPTVIVSRLEDPDHKAGLARHEMASLCCSTSDQTCRGETHLGKVHQHRGKLKVQVANVFSWPAENYFWNATQDSWKERTWLKIIQSKQSP